jgi:hypothetical protein
MLEPPSGADTMPPSGADTMPPSTGVAFGCNVVAFVWPVVEPATAASAYLIGKQVLPIFLALSPHSGLLQAVMASIVTQRATETIVRMLSVLGLALATVSTRDSPTLREKCSPLTRSGQTGKEALGG